MARGNTPTLHCHRQRNGSTRRPCGGCEAVTGKNRLIFIAWDEEALLEADAAIKFYQQKQPNLGKRFLDNLEDAVSRIAHHPYAYRQIEANIRKCKLPHFPYGVIYRIQADTIQIIAVMHLRQEPGYWKLRI